jgi:hypothetical protein
MVDARQARQTWERTMHLDAWMKFVFTVIALSLAVIAWKLPVSGTSYAQAGACGGTGFNPCYVSTAGDDFLNVRVVNR